MKLVLIDDDNRDYFKSFVPPEFASFLVREDMTAIGLVKERKLGAVPLGVMVLSLQLMDTLTVEWIYVDPENRGQSYSQELLDYAFTVAKEEGLTKVVAKVRVPVDEGGDKLVEVQKSWLMDQGFVPASKPLVDWFFYPEECAKFIKTQPDPNLKSLRDIPSALVRAEQEQVAKEFGGRVAELLDMNVSSAYVENNRVVGKLTIAKFDETYIPLELESEYDGSEGKRVRQLLMSASIKKMAEASGEEGILQVICNEKSTLSEIIKFFELENGVYTEFFEAPSDEIEKDIARYEERQKRLEEALKKEEELPTHFEFKSVEYLSGVVLDDEP